MRGRLSRHPTVPELVTELGVDDERTREVPRPTVATATSSDGGVAEDSRVSPALSPVEQTGHERGKLSKPSVKRRLKARAGHKLSESPDALRGSAADAKAKLGDTAQGVGDRLSNAAGPAVSSIAEWVSQPPTPPLSLDAARGWPYA